LLPQIYRLKNKIDFKKIYQNGKSLANPYIVIYVFKKPVAGNPRIGFSVSKKLGCAVCRNKIKRRMREAIKPYLKLIKPNNVDIIFIARFKIKGISFKLVEKNMVNLLKRTNLLD